MQKLKVTYVGEYRIGSYMARGKNASYSILTYYNLIIIDK